MDGILWAFLIIGVAILMYTLRVSRGDAREPFVGFVGTSLTALTTQALDAAPTTSEAKDLYKKLLIFADADIRKQGVQGLRILADFRDRVYGKRDFRDDLVVEDFLANWPAWLAPMDPTIKEPVPDSTEAATAEAQLLAYLQKNFPQEDMVDEQTGSTIRNLVEDFGYRFVFKKGKETVVLGPDFLKTPLLRGWSNPAARA
jgi:hypothetical protein